MLQPAVRWLANLNDGGGVNQFFMALMVTIPVLNFGMLLGWQSPMTPVLQSPDGPAPEPISDDTLSWMAALTFLPPIFCGFHMGGLIDKWGRKNFTMLTSLFLAFPMTPVLQSPDGPAPEPISDDTLSWMAALTFLPPIFCGFHMGGLIDKWGRKNFTMLTSLFLAISWAITLVSLRPWVLITSRVVAGLACAMCYVVTPLYLKEISSDQVRGALGSLFILQQNLGYLVIYVCGDIMPFAAVMWMCAAVPVLHLMAFLMMPETPVFLIKQGKLKEAREALAWLRNTSVNDKNLEEAIQEMEREEEYTKSMKQANFMSLVKDKTRFKAFRIAVNVMLSQETCGYLVVLTYAGSIFEQASESINLKLSPNKQTIVVGTLQMLGSILACSTVEKTGRKWLLASTSFVTGLSMLTLGSWFLATGAGLWLPGWVPVLAMCVCIFADAAGYQPVPYVIMSELFSFQYRGIATALIISLTALSDFVQTKAYDPLLKLLGIHWVFIMFSVICFLGTFYTIMWVPETKGRTVEEIYDILEDKKETKDPEAGKEVSRL